MALQKGKERQRLRKAAGAGPAKTQSLGRAALPAAAQCPHRWCRASVQTCRDGEKSTHYLVNKWPAWYICLLFWMQAVSVTWQKRAAQFCFAVTGCISCCSLQSCFLLTVWDAAICVYARDSPDTKLTPCMYPKALDLLKAFLLLLGQMTQQ